MQEYLDEIEQILLKDIETLKDQNKFDEALVILDKLEPKIARGSVQYKEFLHLKAQCYYQNRDLPAHIRFNKAIEVLAQLKSEKKEDRTYPFDAETHRLTGAIYKRKFHSEKDLSDLYKAIFHYEIVSHDPKRDLGYGAVNTIFLYYTLLDQLKGSLSDEQEAGYREKIRILATETIAALVEDYPTLESRKSKTEWLEPTLAELSMGLYDFEGCNRYLQNSFDESDDYEPINRKEFTTTEQLIRLYDLLPGEKSMKLSAIFEGAFHGKKLHIESIIASVRIGKVGLALSGGGFRASLFHIGVLHRLAELDILRHIQVISSVSGGSIIAMHYYLKLKRLLEKNDNFKLGKEDYQKLVGELEAEFVDGVQTNIRMRAIAKNGGDLTKILGSQYEEQLFKRTGKIPDSMQGLYIRPRVDSQQKASFKPHFNNFELKNKVPILIINATSLNNGHNWRFTASGMGEVPHMYDMTVDKNKIYEYTRYENFPTEFQKVSIGKAVAASSAVPALFDPIDMGKLYNDTDIIKLCDGGVYDNQGIAGLMSEECDIIITSDASKQLPEQYEPSDFRLDVAARVQDILMNKTRDSEIKIAKELSRANQIKGLSILHLKDCFKNENLKPKNQKEQPEVNKEAPCTKINLFDTLDRDVQLKLANIRTDLDAFHDLEAHALIQSGYEITSHWFATYGQDQVIWDNFERNAKKNKEFKSLNEKIKTKKDNVLNILEISVNILFKLMKLSTILRWTIYLSLIVSALILLVYFHQKILLTLGGVAVASIVLYFIPKKYLKQWSNWLLYQLLKPIAFIYLNCFNDLYLKKGKL